MILGNQLGPDMQAETAIVGDHNQSTATCFHCGLPVPAATDLTVEFDGTARPLCCHGCLAVASTILDYGLGDYYRHRTATAETADGDGLIPSQLQAYDNPRLQQRFVRSSGAGGSETTLLLEGINCPACLWLNEQHLHQLDGVLAAEVNYSTYRISLRWDPERISLSRILAAVSEIGYCAYPYEGEQEANLLNKEYRRLTRRLGIAGLFGMQIMMIATAFYADVTAAMSTQFQAFLHWISLLLVLPIVGYSAQPFLAGAWRALRNRRMGMDIPIATGIVLSFAASVYATITGIGEVYYDSVAMFVFLLLLGRFTEFRVRRRAIERGNRLQRILPATARRIDSNGDRVEVPVLDVCVDDELLVLPGETVPVDGIITEHASALDEAMLTGEYLPKLRKVGDCVLGGSVNIDSPLRVRVTHTGDDTLIAGIQRLVEQAQLDKPRLTRIADQVAGWFITIVLTLAALTAIAWMHIDATQWLPITVAVLVISCPCALSLATPTALTAVLSSFLQRGLAVTRGTAIEQLARVSHVAFDKTGTLTLGRLGLRRIETYTDKSEKECLAIAAILESQSEHPVGQALIEAGGEASPALPQELQTYPGAGLSGIIDQQRYYIGSPAFIEARLGTTLRSSFAVLSDTVAETVVILADDQHMLARFVLADRIRSGASELIQAVHERGRSSVLLSGDQQRVVKSVGGALGIGDSRGELTPDAKLEQLRGLQSHGARVAMLGDGINDAPIMAAANVAIAMRQGADISRNQADIIMLGDDISNLDEALRLADHTVAIIRQNIIWALTYNMLAIPFAMLGYVQPWMAAIGMSCSSLLVLLNSSRLGWKTRDR